MATNVASEATDRRAGDGTEADMLVVPQASERSLNQPCESGSTMRQTAQDALNASVVIGRGPDLYDQDGKF